MSRTKDENEPDGPVSRSNLSLDIDTIPDAVIVADADSGRVVDANAAAGDLFHCQPISLIGRDQLALHPSDRGADYAEAFRRGIEGERVNRLQDGAPIQIKTLDGQYKPVEINACRETLDDRVVVIGVFREIATQLEREQQLEAATTRLKTLLDVLPVPVAVLNTDGTVELWNQAAEETFGYTAEAVVGTIGPITMNDDTFEKELDQLLDGEVIDGREEVYRAKDGSRVRVEICARPLYEDGTVSGAVVAGVDVSDRRHRTQQLDILHRVMRHNLRNKIDAIQGWANVINNPDLGDEDAAARIADASQTLLKVSEQAKQIQAEIEADATGAEAVEAESVVTALRELSSKEFPEMPITVADSPTTAVVPAQAKRPILRLGRKILEYVSEGQIDLKTDVQDQYVVVQLVGNTRLLSAGDCSLIRNGEETALQHGSDLTIAQVYLSIESIGGNISFPVETPPASTVCIELPRVNPNNTSDTIY